MLGRGGGQRTSLSEQIALLIAVGMTFASLTSAMLVRRGLGGDWHTLPMPSIALWNVLILAASSVFLELARRRNSRPLWISACLLGALFIGVQAIVWRDLTASGFAVYTNPSSSFFYLLSALHGTHVIGGIAALLATRAVAATWYWHGMSALWIYLMIVFRWME